MSKWAIRSKSEWFAHLLIFGERPQRFVHDSWFLLSNLSESVTVAHYPWATWAIRSLLRSDEMSKSFSFFTVKTYKNTIFSNFFERIAHFLWANKKRSQKQKSVLYSVNQPSKLIALDKPFARIHCQELKDSSGSKKYLTFHWIS